MTATRKDVMTRVAVGALIAFAFYNFVLRPQQAQLASVRAEQVELEQALTAERAQLVTSTTVVPLDAGVASNAAEVPTHPGLADLLRQLQIIGQDTGIAQQTISPGALAVNPGGPGGSLQITIGASGPHAAVATYLQRIRDLDRLMVIDQILVESPGGDAVDHLQLVVRVFTQQTPIDPGVGGP